MTWGQLHFFLFNWALHIPKTLSFPRCFVRCLYVLLKQLTLFFVLKEKVRQMLIISHRLIQNPKGEEIGEEPLKKNNGASLSSFMILLRGPAVVDVISALRGYHALTTAVDITKFDTKKESCFTCYPKCCSNCLYGLTCLP